LHLPRANEEDCEQSDNSRSLGRDNLGLPKYETGVLLIRPLGVILLYVTKKGHQNFNILDFFLKTYVPKISILPTSDTGKPNLAKNDPAVIKIKITSSVFFKYIGLVVDVG
jgi:hypothetical protein